MTVYLQTKDTLINLSLSKQIKVELDLYETESGSVSFVEIDNYNVECNNGGLANHLYNDILTALEKNESENTNVFIKYFLTKDCKYIELEKKYKEEERQRAEDKRILAKEKKKEEFGKYIQETFLDLEAINEYRVSFWFFDDRSEHPYVEGRGYTLYAKNDSVIKAWLEDNFVSEKTWIHREPEITNYGSVYDYIEQGKKPYLHEKVRIIDARKYEKETTNESK